jgi:Zn-dependent protease with chaperone function
LRLRCHKCGLETPEELHFCLNCQGSLLAKTSYDLKITDFAYGPDLDAMRTMNATGPLPYVLKKLTLADIEKTMISNLSTTAQRATYPLDLHSMVRDCGVSLSLEHLPEVFVAENGLPNAFTFGSEEHSYLVINSSLLRALTRLELMAVIAHELAHVKSGHMTYHTLAEVLGGGISLSASLMGLDVISIPVRFALLSWHRQSEVTADRASLLAVDDIDIIESLLQKLASDSARAPLDQYEIQRKPGMLESVGELFRTHPLVINRLKLAKEFWQSQEFLRAKQKIRLRQSLLKALVPICRFCGNSKSTEDLFCPNCGKCQT